MNIEWKNNSWLLLILAFLIYFIPRVVGLGWDITSYDARYWRPRMWNFVEAICEGNFKETYQQYHPGVTLMWLSGFAERSFDLVGEVLVGHDLKYLPKWYPLRHFVAKFPLVFVISLLGATCFYYIKKFTDTKYALIFSFLLSLEPFFLGTSRFLHLSALTSMFMFTSFLLMYVYVSYSSSDSPAGGESRSRLFGSRRPLRACSNSKYLLASAILLGLAVLTKMDGAIGGVANILLLFCHFAKRGASRHTVYPKTKRQGWQGLTSFLYKSTAAAVHLCKNFGWQDFLLEALAYGLISFFVFFALFPAMWFGPVEVIRKMISEGIYDTAFASTGAMMLVPFRHLYYFEAFFLRSLPTTVILVALFPLFFFRRGDKNLKSFVRPILLFLFVNWLILSIPGKTKDRYLVNFSPGFQALAAFSLYRFWDGLKQVPRGVILGLIVFFYLLTTYRYHPVYSFYYNDLIGGPAGIERLGLKIINRGEWFAQAAHFINRQEPYPDIANRNVIIPDRNQLPSFKDYFKGKTYADSKFMPEGYHAHYIVTRKDHLERVPRTCRLIATFGPRAPMRYDLLYAFSCGKTVDNTYKFKN